MFCQKSLRLLHSSGQHRTISRQQSNLCDRILHGSKRLSVSDSDIDRLQRLDACRAFREIGVELCKNFEHPKLIKWHFS